MEGYPLSLALSRNSIGTYLDGPERSKELPEDVLLRLGRQVVDEDAPAAAVGGRGGEGGRAARGPVARGRRGGGGGPGGRRRPGQDGVAGQDVAGEGGVPATQQHAT